MGSPMDLPKAKIEIDFSSLCFNILKVGLVNSTTFQLSITLEVAHLVDFVAITFYNIPYF
jgi:hypothetical protein